MCTAPCLTFFRICLTHHQKDLDPSCLGECSYASITSPVLGKNSFEPAKQRRLFQFNFTSSRWPVSVIFYIFFKCCFQIYETFKGFRHQFYWSLVNNLKQLFFFSSSSTRAGAKGGLAPQSTRLASPINKLTLLKTVAFVLNFKFWTPLINAWPP